MSLIRQSTLILARSLFKNFTTPRIKDETRNIKRWVAPTLHELYKRRVKEGPEPPRPRSSYLEWNYEAEVFAFAKRLGEEFDRKLLKQALTHRSYVNQERDRVKEGGIAEPPNMDHNQNMIGEGSEIISRYLIDGLSKGHPDDVVKALHDYLTTEEMLAHVGKHMGLTDIILTAEFPVATSTLSDTFKAVVAALHHSHSLDRAHLLVKDFLLCQLIDKEVFDIWTPESPLDYLRDLLKKRGIEGVVEPRLCHTSATSTILANYQMGLYNNRKLLGLGWGESIEIAKETAALDAIHRLHYRKQVKSN